MTDSFFRYNPFFIRRLFNCQKYFILEYTAMVGVKKYSVKTIR